MSRIFRLFALFFCCFSYKISAQTLMYSDNFESGMGNWLNTTLGDNKNWMRDSDGTPSSGTGPNTGADGSRYYMYLETSSGQAYSPGDSAILEFPNFAPISGSVKFKYHMYGSDIGTLAVDLYRNGVWSNNVWSISGQQHASNSSPYTEAEVSFTDGSVSGIRFRATAAGNFLGDISIDDIEIWSQPTGPVAPEYISDPITKPNAKPYTTYSDSIASDAFDSNQDPLTFSKTSGPSWLTITPSGDIEGTPTSNDLGLNTFTVAVTDGIFVTRGTLNITVSMDPVVLIEEYFESSVIQWRNLTREDTDNWTIRTGNTTSSNTGPDGGADGSAGYLYFETSSGYAFNPGESAIFESPQLEGENIHLVFSYHMYGSNIGTLSIDILENSTWHNDVWTLSGQQHSSSAEDFNTVDLDLTEYAPTLIRVRAVAAGGYMGDIAIDNLLILSQASLPDEDGDGIDDGIDNCPNTPPGAEVDEHGCELAPVDSDGDGFIDSEDAFPQDPTEWADTDIDGVGDNSDAFPNDPTETKDSDGDGVGDNSDQLPFDPNETVDSDGDGVGDNSDVFPNDPNESADSDGDGVGDNADAFPNDPNEHVDSDNDGVGDNADKYPAYYSNVASVNIVSPTMDIEIDAGEPLVFQADAFDINTGDITSSIIWESDATGPFEPDSVTGEFTLPHGEHAIVAIVTDSLGNLASNYVRVVVKNDKKATFNVYTQTKAITDVSSNGAYFVGHKKDSSYNPLVIFGEAYGFIERNTIKSTQNFKIANDGTAAGSMYDYQGSDAWGAVPLVIREFNHLESSTQALPFLPDGVAEGTHVYNISPDGKSIVGYGVGNTGRWDATVWHLGETISISSNRNGTDNYNVGMAISDNGVVAGHSGSDPNFMNYNQAWRWQIPGQLQLLGNLTGGNNKSMANGITPDGRVIVGYASSDLGHEAYRWTEETGMVGLGKALTSNFMSMGQIAVSADGNVVVGNASDGPFIWTKGLGARNLQAYLEEFYGFEIRVDTDPDRTYSISTVHAISDDGRVVTGTIRGYLAGYPTNDFGFVATLSPRENEITETEKISLGNRIRTSPVQDSLGRTYLATDDDIMIALDVDQSELWRFPLTEQIAQPVIDETQGVIYFGSHDTNFYALNLSDGSVRWSMTPATRPYSQPAIGPDGTIYLLTVGFRLHAINPGDGTSQWVTEIPYQGSFLPEPYYPVVNEFGQIFVHTVDELIHSVNTDGSIAWSTPIRELDPGTRRSIQAPAFAQDGSLLVTRSDGKLISINQAGSVNWIYDSQIENTSSSSFNSAATVGEDGTIYLPLSLYEAQKFYYHSDIIALNPDASVQWQYQLPYQVKAPLTLDASGNIIAVHNRGVHAMTPAGKLLWYTWVDAGITSKFPTSYFQQLVLGDTEGGVYFFDLEDYLTEQNTDF
ncbi:Alpha-agarase [Thalassocella blandensis]|nr:Alpha-agarase [Thalassocella blandensis]